MIRRSALVAIAALTACSGEQRRENDRVSVVEGERGSAPGRRVEARPTTVAHASVAAAPAAPTTSTTSPPGIDAPTPVHGDFTDRPLPAELAHLNGLGGTASHAEERTP